MKNAFLETYKATKALATRLEAAATEEEKDLVRKEYKDVIAWLYEDGDAACQIWPSCRRSYNNGNLLIDLDDNVSKDNVSEIVSCLRNNGVTKFTFSSTWSGAIESAWLFQQNGCTLVGLVEVIGDNLLPHSNEHEKMPALLFKLD